MYHVGYSSDYIYEYNLGTGYDLTTITNSDQWTQRHSVSSQMSDPGGMCFNNDGTRMFVVGLVNNRVYQYILSTAYDIGGVS
jgi:sugar lactone lactonase YvrE